MRTSELIKKLQSSLEENGDCKIDIVFYDWVNGRDVNLSVEDNDTIELNTVYAMLQDSEVSIRCETLEP